MIKTMRLRSFKAFEDTGMIDLRPITVLAGPNSGGKSSILQSLLLLKQTLETYSPDVKLNLDGRFLQFSRLNELAFGKPPLQQSKVSYQFILETHIPSNVVPDYFPDLEIPKNADTMTLQSEVELLFRYRVVEEGRGQVILHHFDIKSGIQGITGPRLSFTVRRGGNQVRLEGVDLREPFEGRRIRDVAFRHFLPGFLILEQDRGDDRDRSPAVRLDPIFWLPLRHLEAELKDHLRYLGPLREEPQRAYLHSGSPYPEIGNKGEYAAQMLWIEKENLVEYLPGIDQEVIHVTLLEAVSHVFQRLGIDHPVNVKSVRDVMYQILFRLFGSKGRKQVTIADVGFGVSQLLPVVIMGLRSPDESLLVFEQPEIHLHPSLQANLADFFLTLALSGKRLLIETHSDHFINRLRRRIAEDSRNELKGLINILFVRPQRNGRGAIVEPLKIDKFGIIENWPPEFLPESADEAEAIFRAGLKKRQSK